jgi:taurine dioxygenase
VRTHPVTGLKSLFVNPSYTLRINDIPKAESDAVLAFLYQHCTNPNFQMRFQWEPHSVAFWDNRCTQHLAVWDYYPNVRSGYRVTIKGEKPV